MALTQQPAAVRALGGKSGPSRATSAAATAVIGLAPVIAGYVFYNRWLALFPQIEFRTWLWSNSDFGWFVRNVFTQAGAFSHSSTFLLDSSTESACGVAVRCLNEPGFWVILLAGYALYWLIVRLTGAVVAAAVGATLWVLSLPVLDAMGWQATMDDRVAALFGLVTIHAALSAMRWIDRKGPHVARVACANVLVLIVAIIPYNAKEISWLLLPSLVLLAVALEDDWQLHAIARRVSVLALTAVYAVFRTVSDFVLIEESPASNTLEFGGRPAHNANLYTANLSNHLYPNTLTHVLVALVVLAMALAVVRYRSAKSASRAQIRIMAWAALTLLGGLVICLFTPVPTPYLLMLPSPFLWVALVALWRSAPLTHRIVRPAAGLGLAALTATIVLIGLNGAYPVYGELLSWSKGYRRTVPQITRHVPVGAEVDFVLGAAPFAAYRFVGDEGQRVVDQFFYHNTGLFTSAEGRMKNVQNPVPGFAGYSIVFAGDMSVAEILHGSRVVYQAPPAPT